MINSQGPICAAGCGDALLLHACFVFDPGHQSPTRQANKMAAQVPTEGDYLRGSGGTG